MTIKEVEFKEIQGWDAFVEKYKPIANKFSSQPNEYTFETYGEEVEFVKSQDIHNIWTWVDGDECSLLVAGFAYVNRIGYHITEVPWTDEDEYVLLSQEVECECYDEEAVDNGEREEYGDPDCDKCEGYGRVTEYVG
jgi:hypothetical protein